MVKKSKETGLGLGFQDVATSQLVKADWNYKKEDPKLTEKLTENIKRNGFIENIIIRELDTGYYEVVNGNHRLDVAKQIGMAEIHCYNLGKISEARAKKIAIAGNETRFESDEIKLTETLRELQAEFNIEELVAELPYTLEQLKSREGLLDYDWGTDFAGAIGEEDEDDGDSKKKEPKSKDLDGMLEMKIKIPLECESFVERLFSSLNKKANDLEWYGRKLSEMCKLAEQTESECESPDSQLDDLF